MERMKEYRYPFLFLEFDLESVINYPIGSKIPKRRQWKIRINGQFIMKKILELQIKYNVHVVFCNNATAAQTLAVSTMNKVWSETQHMTMPG